MNTTKSFLYLVICFLMSIAFFSCGSDKTEEEIEVVTSISIREGNSLTLQIGETRELSIDHSPSHLPTPIITWKSNNTEVVSVENGKVTAQKDGTAIVTASAGGRLTASCTITVTPIAVNSIKISESTKITKIGDSITLTATYEPQNATYGKLLWSSSNTAVAEVSEGVVSCIGAGSCSIIVEDEKHCAKAICELTVEAIEVESITLDCTSKELTVGDSFILQAAVLPENATDKQLVWQSSDDNIASVYNGEVIALSAGSCIISATNGTGTVTAQCCISIAPFEVKAVDLGLPSGTLWCNVNVNASTPEQFGGFYAWGEIDEKESYQWKNYKYCYDSTFDIQLSKYKIHNFADFKISLELIDDAASINMGKKWKIPTQRQMWELCKECEWTLSENKGVKGYIIKGKNDNSIFLPISGRKSKDVEDKGTVAYYWINGLSLSSDNEAEIFIGNGSDLNCFNTISRYYGCPIRPVMTQSVRITNIKTDLKSEEVMTVGSKIDLKSHFTVEPKDADINTLVWSSSDDSVVSVDENGIIEGKSEGVATIKAETEDGTCYTTIKFTVIDKDITELITFRVSNNGIKMTVGSTIIHAEITLKAEFFNYSGVSITSLYLYDSYNKKDIKVKINKNIDATVGSYGTVIIDNSYSSTDPYLNYYYWKCKFEYKGKEYEISKKAF